jgi:alanine racemase
MSTPNPEFKRVASSLPTRCWIEVNPEALKHNARVLRSRLPAGTELMAVVKANAYGHGTDGVVPALEREVDAFAVANVREALDVRGLSQEKRIFILSPCLPGERESAVRAGFIPAVSSCEEARLYAAVADKCGTVAVLHAVIDTGMGRIGVWEDDAIAVAREIARMDNVRLAYLSTHLPVADEDSAFTDEQLRRWAALAKRIREETGQRAIVHALNSAGIIGFPAMAGDMVRAGLALYGISPIGKRQHEFQQAMVWKTRVTLVRAMGVGRGISYGRTYITTEPKVVATLAAGYADGYPRHLSGTGASVLIRGKRCEVLGRVTMDQIMVDITALDRVEPGEEAVLCGRQGTEEILASELAQRAGTIAWEIFTGAGRASR